MSDGFALSPPDEFFNHQYPLPHRIVASSDPGWRERYWISMFDTVEKGTVCSFGFGKYPNRDVMDAFVIVARGGVQQNVRASRQLLPHNDQIAVGPFSARILVPFEELEFRLEDNPSGVRFDLRWSASVAPALEGRHFEVSRARNSHDLVRYVQTGVMRGILVNDGERIEIESHRWWGVRDHSWGIRPMSPLPGDPPLASVAWNFLMFCPIRFPSFSIHIYLFESQPGRPTYLTASLMRPFGAPEQDDAIRTVEHELAWEEGAAIQTLRSGTIRLHLFNGRTMEIALRVCPGRAFLAGGGYGTFQGKWFGENHLEHDVWDCFDESRLRQYNAHSSDHLVEAECDGETGYGIIEYLIRRGYPKYAEAHPPRR